MEPLFRTKSVFNFEEYRKFNWIVSGKKTAIALAVVCPLILLCGLYIRSWISVALAVLFPLIMLFTYKVQLKRVYGTNKLVDNLEAEYCFYEDEFSVKDAKSEAAVPYKYLYKIIFTDTNVYLMISKNQGYMLIKENFPDGLCDFLKTIAPAKRKK